MSNGNGHRWSKFWWQDWQSDLALRQCSLAAQGLWMRLLCIMHESDGYLLLDGKPPTDAQLARLVGAHWREVRTLLAELLRLHVCRKNETGIIYSKRMCKDLEASQEGAQHAKKRWDQPKNDVPPNGPPNGSPNGEACANAYRPPNAKKLEAEARKKAPPVAPHGGARAAPKPRRNAFHELERQFLAAQAGGGPTIDGNADDVVLFDEFLEQRRRLAHG